VKARPSTFLSPRRAHRLTRGTRGHSLDTFQGTRCPSALPGNWISRSSNKSGDNIP